mgnify:CR=1 FL=1
MPTTDPSAAIPPTNSSARPLALIACGLGLLSTGYGFSLALSDAGIRWPVLGLEAASLIACLFGLLAGIGKVREGVGITIGFAAVALFIGTGLSLVSLEVAARLIPTHPWFLARLGICGLIMLAAVAAVLGTDRGAWLSAIKGGVLTAIGLGVVAAVVLTGSWITSGSTTAQVVKVVGALVVVTVGAGLLCVGVHLVVGAFERRATLIPPAGATPA